MSELEYIFRGKLISYQWCYYLIISVLIVTLLGTPMVSNKHPLGVVVPPSSCLVLPLPSRPV